MENILLVLNIIFALILVLLVLMQKSEGGASQDPKKFFDIIKKTYN